VETNQIIAVNSDFHGMAVRFLYDDPEMESDLPQESVVLGLGSKNRHEFGSSTHRSSIRVSNWKEVSKLGNESTNHSIKGTF
jgi:arginase family enzyme